MIPFCCMQKLCVECSPNSRRSTLTSSCEIKCAIVLTIGVAHSSLTAKPGTGERGCLPDTSAAKLRPRRPCAPMPTRRLILAAWALAPPRNLRLPRASHSLLQFHRQLLQCRRLHFRTCQCLSRLNLIRPLPRHLSLTCATCRKKSCSTLRLRTCSAARKMSQTSNCVCLWNK